MANDVPHIVVHRLPLYLRALELMAESGQRITSSQELGQRLGLSSAQIRKDLSSYFGAFGKQGTGYEVAFLIEQLRRILQVDQSWDMVVVGAGDLGHALVRYGGFRARNFCVRALFDVDPTKIGTTIGSLVVEHEDQMVARLRAAAIQIGIIAAPARVAQHVADLLVEGGVRAILNYAPITLKVPEGVLVEYIDPVTALQSMTFYLERSASPAESQP